MPSHVGFGRMLVTMGKGLGIAARTDQINVTYTFTHDGSTDRSYSISTYTGIDGVDVIGAGNVGTTAASCTTTCALPNGGSNTLTTGAT